MKRIFFSLMMVAALALSACASPTNTSPTQPSFSDQIATGVAATMQELPTNTPAAITPESPAELLPHTLYYLGRDDNTGLTQVFRMERDGKTKTQLTYESDHVVGYAFSLVDGSVAYVINNQLLMVNADGSNRHLLVDGGQTLYENNPQFFKDPLLNPVFSPDGQTIAYSHRGLDLYEISTGASTLVLQGDVYGSPQYYSPVSYSPDGKKLLIEVGQWEAPPAIAVYYPDTNTLAQSSPEQGFFCCSGSVWSLDGSSFYGIVRAFQFAFQVAAIQRVDAATGTVTTLFPFIADSTASEIMSSPNSPYFAPDGWLYYFFGSYRVDSGYYEPPVIQLIRSAPDGVTNRTVIRNENFVLMNEALWAPDASFVIVSMMPSRFWNRDEGGGVLELYFTDAQKSVVWLAPFGYQMKWGP